jgi:hypothetical protein
MFVSVCPSVLPNSPRNLEQYLSNYFEQSGPLLNSKAFKNLPSCALFRHKYTLNSSSITIHRGYVVIKKKKTSEEVFLIIT